MLPTPQSKNTRQSEQPMSSVCGVPGGPGPRFFLGSLGLVKTRVGVSSRGKTAVFKTVYVGSSPTTPGAGRLGCRPVHTRLVLVQFQAPAFLWLRSHNVTARTLRE